MATPSRHAAVALTLSQRLRRDPQAFEWLQALLLLEREQPQANSSAAAPHRKPKR